MNTLQQKYNDQIKKALQEEFKAQSEMAVPKVIKVVINIGSGDAKDNATILEAIKDNLGLISGQRPVVTKARKSISSFKLTQGQPIGVMVTLRRDRMYAFLEKLFNAVLPKVRDFRGLSDQSFDGQGNYNLGLREQIIFPEVDYKSADKTRGLQITISTSAKNRQEGKRLLELMGMPFAKQQ